MSEANDVAIQSKFLNEALLVNSDRKIRRDLSSYPFHSLVIHAISLNMNEKQQEFIIWLLKLIGVGLWGPFLTNILSWLTGEKFPSIFNFISSVILLFLGFTLLFWAFQRLKEKRYE